MGTPNNRDSRLGKARLKGVLGASARFRAQDTEGKWSEFRLDFLKAETNGVLTWEPDPRRYSWVEERGKRFLHDKFEDVNIPEDAVEDFLRRIQEAQLHDDTRDIDDAHEYVSSRKPVIDAWLDGIRPQVGGRDRLIPLVGKNWEFVILSLDVVGSTKLSMSLEDERYASVITLLQQELSRIVAKFGGSILNYAGDGFVAFFPAPTMITQSDLAIDCALTLRRFVYEALNPSLKDHGLAPIEIRIGLDAGTAYVTLVGSPEAHQQADIIGYLVNLATKIQSKAPAGAILIGASALGLLHTMWRVDCKPFQVAGDDQLADRTGAPYAIYRMDLSPY